MRRVPYDKKLSIGYGYIVIPKDTPREAFVENCLRTGRLSILTGTNEFYSKVRFSKSIVNYIEFPDDYQGMGSLVIWVMYPLTKDPLIVGILSRAESTENIKEHQFILDKEYKGNLITFLGDAKSARGIFNVVGKKAKIFISTYSPDSDSEIKFKTDSFLLLNTISREDTFDMKEINVGNTFTIQVKDFEKDEILLKISGSKSTFFIETGENKIEIKKDTISINGRSGVGILSKSGSLKEVLDKLIQTIGQSTTVVNGAPVPLTNAAEILAIKTSLSKVLK